MSIMKLRLSQELLDQKIAEVHASYTREARSAIETRQRMLMHHHFGSI